MSDLLSDLLRGESESRRDRPCPMCDYIKRQTGQTKEALERAAAGTIGINKLAAILRDRDTGIGRRTVQRHREEGHTS